jgi:hypothetical protein
LYLEFDNIINLTAMSKKKGNKNKDRELADLGIKEDNNYEPMSDKRRKEGYDSERNMNSTPQPPQTKGMGGNFGGGMTQGRGMLDHEYDDDG